MEPIRLKIVGPPATGTLETVEAALRLVPGVMSAHALSGGKEFRVEAAETVSTDELVAAALRAGCTVTPIG